MLVVLGILPGIIVYLTKHVIDSIVAAKNSNGDWTQVSQAIGFLGLMGAALVLTELLKNLSSLIRVAQSEVVNDHITNIIHEQAGKVDLAFYESSEYYDLMERAKGDSSSKPLALMESLGAIIQNSITMLALVAILLTYASWLTLVLFFAALPALYISLNTDKNLS